MLPSICANVKTKLIAGVTALAVLTAGTAPAQAWGKNEQQFVAGAVTALALGALILNSPKYGQARPVYQPQYQQKPQYYTPRTSHKRPVRYEPAPVSIYSTPAGMAFNTYTSNERRRIQSTLTAYGYYRGSIDGSFGPGTYGAIDAYARRTGKTSMLASRAGAYGLLDALLF